MSLTELDKALRALARLQGDARAWAKTEELLRRRLIEAQAAALAAKQELATMRRRLRVIAGSTKATSKPRRTTTHD